MKRKHLTLQIYILVFFCFCSLGISAQNNKGYSGKSKRTTVRKTAKNEESYPVRQSQKITPPTIVKDSLLIEERQMKQISDLRNNMFIGAEKKDGTNERIVAPSVAVPPPPPLPPPAEATEEEMKQDVENKIFEVVEEQPKFNGGNGALMSWLASNMQYPPDAEKGMIQGRVVVSFVVEKDGSITQAKVVRSVEPSLDKEAVRLVEAMPKWIPGKQNGKTVRTRYNLPVTFKLQ